MPILHQFDYSKPRSLEEALALLSQHKSCAVLAGGTDLIDRIRVGADRPAMVVDIKGLGSLGEIKFERGELHLGAGVTFSDLIASEIIQENFPVIVELARTVASVGIRNRATVAGNICSAVPCMDSGPLLSAYDANVIVAGPNGMRKIPADRWFVDNRKTAIEKGEIVTGVSFPSPEQKHAGCWVKLRRYAGEDLAQVNLLILALAGGSFRISFGAVAPVPVRAKKIEKLLRGQTIGHPLVEEASRLIEEEIKPITDIRASREYRMHMAKVMFERGLSAAVRRLRGDGPVYGTSLI